MMSFCVYAICNISEAVKSRFFATFHKLFQVEQSVYYLGRAGIGSYHKNRIEEAHNSKKAK